MFLTRQLTTPRPHNQSGRSICKTGRWGPGYMHAMWYATIEGRPTSEFVHLLGRGRVPHGSIVITSDENGENCEIIKRSGVYLLYGAK